MRVSFSLIALVAIWTLAAVSPPRCSADSAHPGRLLVRIEAADGLSPEEHDSLPRDLTVGITRRIQERGIVTDGMSGPEWLLSGQIARLADQGAYVLTLSLAHREQQTEITAYRWVGSAASHRALAFYKGYAQIQPGGLIDEMALRVARALRTHEPEPELRCFRELEEITSSGSGSDSRSRSTAPRVDLVDPAGAPDGTAVLSVAARAAGRVWAVAVIDHRLHLINREGADLKRNGAVKLPLPAGAHDAFILFRLNKTRGMAVSDPRAPQGDGLVSVLEMRAGYGTTDVALLNLLDGVRKDGADIWCLRRASQPGVGPQPPHSMAAAR